MLRRCAFAGLLAFAVALCLFCAVGALRLWPRISGQHLPFSLIWPFARPLLAAGLELAFLVSLPTALGLSASLRAARTPSGASWQATAGATGLLLVELGTLGFGVSSWLEGRGSSPGQLAAELVASARESCVETPPPAEVGVPLLGFAWSCRAGRAPRLQGHAPIGNLTTFAATAITLSDDLKRIALDGFELSLPLGGMSVQVHVPHATLSGLPPWGRSRRTPFGVRVFLFALSAGIAAYGVGRVAARRPWLPAWAGAALGAGISSCLWWATAWLERQEPRPLSYLALPASALCGVALVAGSLLLVQLLISYLHRARPGGTPE